MKSITKVCSSTLQFAAFVAVFFLPLISEGLLLGFKSKDSATGGTLEGKSLGIKVIEEPIHTNQADFKGCFTTFETSSECETFQTSLGEPKGRKFLCIHRFKLWWMKPLHVKNAQEVPLQTLMVMSEDINEKGDPIYSVFLPLIDNTATCTLHGGNNGELELLAETGDPATKLPLKVKGLFVGEGKDPFVTIQMSMEAVKSRQYLKQSVHDTTENNAKILESPNSLSTLEPAKENFIDKLGWCTWDSFYTMVNHDNVIQGLDRFKEDGLNFGWIIIDDGWQSTTNPYAKNAEQWDDQLTSFRENNRFSEGGSLKSAVSAAKSKFKIDHVLVWHTIAGYWAGVDPGSEEMGTYKPKQYSLQAPDGIYTVDPAMKKEFDEKEFGMIDPGFAKAFFEDYHSYLGEQGVDGVKVDAQALLNAQGKGNGGTTKVTSKFVDALEASIFKTFSTGRRAKEGSVPPIIHCMCHTPEILEFIPKLYSESKTLLRGGDDFYPDDIASHSPHLYAQTYNSLFINFLGLRQDWDMFQTYLGDLSTLHASARAISGGPIYISDRPGEQNMSLIRKLVLEDGSVLRPLGNALPTLDSLFNAPTQSSKEDHQGLMKIWNMNPTSGVLGLFNIAGAEWSQEKRAYSTIEGVEMSPRHGTLSPLDVYGMNGTAGESYSVYLHQQRSLHVMLWEETLPVELQSLKSEIASVSKINEVPDARCEFAAIGLVEMFNSGGAVIHQEIYSGTVLMKIKGSGQFEAICTKKPNRISLQYLHADAMETKYTFEELNMTNDKKKNITFSKLKIDIPSREELLQQNITFQKDKGQQQNIEPNECSERNGKITTLKIEWI